MSGHLEEVLKKLGWQDGFQVPLANPENQELEKELARLTLQKLKSKRSFELIGSRLEALHSHKKFVLQETEQCQKLITAHRQQLESEEHQFFTHKADKSRMMQELNQIGKRLKDLEERSENKRQTLQRHMTKIEKLKVEAKWDEEAVAAWEESLKKRDEDNELIKKISKQDQIIYNELEAKRQNLKKEHSTKSDVVKKLFCEYNNCEMVIERTGKEIKQQTTERDALIKQWKETVKILQQRDNVINQIQSQTTFKQELIQREKDILEEQTNFLENEKRNNHQLELEMQELNSFYSRMRREHSDLIEFNVALNSEINVLKKQVMGDANKLERERMKLKHLKTDIEEHDPGTKGWSKNVEKLREKLKSLQEKTMTTSERIKNLEVMIDNEMYKERHFLVDIDKYQMLIYRAEQQLEHNKRIGNAFTVKIDNCSNKINQLKKQIKDIKINRNKMREAIYELNFEIDQTEQKMDNLEQDIQDEDHEEKEKFHAKLEQTVAEHEEIKNTLQFQLSRIQDEMQRINIANINEKEILEKLKSQCEKGSLVYEVSVRQLLAAKQSTQEKQVEENLVRLRINNFETDVKKEDDCIFSLQKLEVNLEQALRQRQVEIATSKAILEAKKRNLDEEKGRLKIDISGRRIKIEQFQKKYHLAIMSLGKNEDGEPLSITHFKIKNSQEKFMLQEEGDKLDSKIKTAEKEIVAMENTLKVMNLTNNAFKQSMSPVKDTDKEAETMNNLEKQLREIEVVVKEKTNEFFRLQTELVDLQNQLNEDGKKFNEIKQYRDKLQDDYESIKTQEMDKDEKLKRITYLLKKVSKKLQKDKTMPHDRDFEIRQLRDANKEVMDRLVGMLSQYQDVAPLINRYALEYKITLPEKKLTPSISSRSTMSSPSVCSFASSGAETVTSIAKIVLAFDL